MCDLKPWCAYYKAWNSAKWILGSSLLSICSATAPPKPVKNKQAMLVKQEICRKWMILQLLNQSCSPSIDRLIRASGLFGREMKILRITGGQCCKDAEWFSTYTLVSSPHSSFRRLVCIAWANNFLNQLYCTVCGYWQNAFLRSFADSANIVWQHCKMFTLFISSPRGDSSTGKCCKGGWVRLQFARWICIVLILSYEWLYDTVLVLSLAVFRFVAFSWLCATETFKQDHFFQTHVFHVLFSWMCARGCWVNAWRKWLSLKHKARVSFAIAVTCNILLHYFTRIFLLHTYITQ